MALDERHQIKTQLDKTHRDFMKHMKDAMNLKPMFMNLKKLNEDYQRLMISQEKTVKEFDRKISIKVDKLRSLEENVSNQEYILKCLLKQEPLIKAEFKRQEIIDSKKKIEIIMDKHKEQLISRHDVEIAEIKEHHQKKIEKIDCYKMSLSSMKKRNS